MTDTERNTALAALIGPEGYEAAKECPQGHEFIDAEDCMYDPAPGELCWVCAENVVRSDPGEASRHSQDREWHPEWRVQSIPKDFAAPGVLEPLARELVARWHAENHQYGLWVAHYDPYCEGNPPYTVLVLPIGKGIGLGDTYEIALGEALLNAARNR